MISVAQANIKLRLMKMKCCAYSTGELPTGVLFQWFSVAWQHVHTALTYPQAQQGAQHARAEEVTIA